MLFAGQYYDTESGLYYLRARYHDPATAQFLSVDPEVATTAVPYAYASDDPINENDPKGLDDSPNGYLAGELQQIEGAVSFLEFSCQKVGGMSCQELGNYVFFVRALMQTFYSYPCPTAEDQNLISSTCAFASDVFNENLDAIDQACNGIGATAPSRVR